MKRISALEIQLNFQMLNYYWSGNNKPDSYGKDLELRKINTVMPADGALSEAVKPWDLTMEGFLPLS